VKSIVLSSFHFGLKIHVLQVFAMTDRRYLPSQANVTDSELVIIRFGRYCSGTESVTALICSSQNRTRYRIFAFVSLLFGNLQRSKFCTCILYIYHSTTLHVMYLPVIRTNRDVNELSALQYCNIIR